jgi:hypothetical protein
MVKARPEKSGNSVINNEENIYQYGVEKLTHLIDDNRDSGFRLVEHSTPLKEKPILNNDTALRLASIAIISHFEQMGTKVEIFKYLKDNNGKVQERVAFRAKLR